MKRPGYTLVELLIVIALAGMIASLIYFAVSQGNRDQRDDARKADAGRYLDAVTQWTSDHSGVPPSTQLEATSVRDTYVTAGSSKFADPNGTSWDPQWHPSAGTPSGLGTMWLGVQFRCNSGGFIAGGTRQYAVAVVLESGGSYCVSN